MTHSVERFASTGKYCDYYWSVKKQPEGFVWKIRGKWGGEVIQSSLSNEDGFKYFDTYTAAISDCYEAIQDYYS